MSARGVDVVVLGATGVTGRGVAAYLAERAPGAGLSWAAAARDPGKLARVLAESGVRDAPTLIADIGDADSLARLAAGARVVLDLVGPYTLYGRPVIEACVREGAHYADLTGEIPFVRGVIEEFDAAARAAGVKLVQVAGFEALPPDLAVRLAAEAARERHGEPLASADVEVWVSGPPGLPRASDAISGGTLQSLLAVAASTDSGSISDPAALVLEPAAAAAIRRVSPIGLAPRRGALGDVIAPMAPAPFINPAVIHRSALLAEEQAGRPAAPFRYREGLALAGTAPTTPLRWGAAGALSATQVALRAMASSSPAARRRIVGALRVVTPRSGFGPKGERLQRWRWGLRAHALTEARREVRVDVDADGHPGYLATARMLGELGLLLAQDGATPAVAGAVTPSIALGTASAPSFAHAGVRFSTHPVGH
jgi:short subunit dehydrogenase-like uncharacterized protein